MLECAAGWRYEEDLTMLKLHQHQCVGHYIALHEASLAVTSKLALGNSTRKVKFGLFITLALGKNVWTSD
jgi:hypothetical protein